MEKELVSVVIATYNDENFIYDAVESIIKQTYSNLEIIVVDDCSNDKTANIVQSIHDDRIIYIRNSLNKGLPYSLNKGIEKARGKYIARMDGDDICIPTRIEKQINYMKEHENIMVISCSALCFGESHQKRYAVEDPEMLKIMLLHNPPLIHPGYMFRREIFDEGYRYDENFLSAQDYELLSRISDKYLIGNIPEVLLKYRIHSNQITKKKSKQQIQNANKVRKKLLNDLGISLNKIQMISYYNEISLKKGNILREIFIHRLYEMIIRSNHKRRIYDEKKLKYYLYKRENEYGLWSKKN